MCTFTTTLSHWEMVKDRPEDDPERLASMTNYAGALGTANDHATAIKLLEKCLAIQRRVFGDSHQHGNLEATRGRHDLSSSAREGWHERDLVQV
eukprot:COSAG02_NODE_8991_length_2370_cov_2.599295_2_plen_94_part_00